MGTQIYRNDCPTGCRCYIIQPNTYIGKIVQIQFSGHLHRFVQLPQKVETELATLPEIIDELESRFPGFAGYVVHENGSLRQHVNIFLDDRIIQDRQSLGDSLDGVKLIFFMQALSGG